MERILVAIDASPRARPVLDMAASIAQTMGAKLVLFHAVGVPHGVPQEAYSMSPDALAELLDKHGKQYLEQMTAHLPAGLVEKTVVVDGIGWRAICAAADEHDVDLIVIGSHGYSGMDRVLGTTAAKVVNHSSRSVLVVRSS
jgi:nucleotide-binding universal stress UspA family protein